MVKGQYYYFKNILEIWSDFRTVTCFYTTKPTCLESGFKICDVKDISSDTDWKYFEIVINYFLINVTK